MVSREYFLKQAETCLRLADTLGQAQAEVAHRLQELANEYQQKASEAEPRDKDT
jgi:hypothetical protein